MINPRVALLFKNLPDKHPRTLERDYPHILNRLMQLWAMPEFEPYMHDLMIDKRGDRQGFPLEVVAELVFLGELHDIFKSKGYQLPDVEDPWKAIPVPNPTPQGFLHAIERGQQDVMETFLSAGVPIDYRFEGGQTPLMIAAINGQRGMVHCLIEDGAGINLRDAGRYTALHWAAFYGHTQLLDELLDFGAEINAVQNSGDTPLSLAVTKGRIAVARLLLVRQADPNIASTHGSPLVIAMHRDNQEMVGLLKRCGAHT
ncbi:MAG: ankyrin repeat domain-containing protein [Nitrosomonadales bacterium]|nr:ankyrin repeat domain-containing protein [Nitrosomonadales bacterium]